MFPALCSCLHAPVSWTRSQLKRQQTAAMRHGYVSSRESRSRVLRLVCSRARIPFAVELYHLTVHEDRLVVRQVLQQDGQLHDELPIKLYFTHRRSIFCWNKATSVLVIPSLIDRQSLVDEIKSSGVRPNASEKRKPVFATSNISQSQLGIGSSFKSARTA